MKDKTVVATDPDNRIVSFVKSQTVFTLAVNLVNSPPYCAPCFYAYSETHNALVFKSSRDTKHIIGAIANSVVGGSILPDKLSAGKVKGVQFTGLFIEPKDDLLLSFQKVYYKKYPFAMAMSGDIWAVEFRTIKFTDNTLGFGTKLLWQHSEL